MMPEVDGYEVLKTIRQEDQKLPILILSAKDQARDKIEALRGGVDDYLSKPFNLDEFLLRVERLLTRSNWNKSGTKSILEGEGHELESFTFGENTIDFIKSKAQTSSGEINLTAQELKLLALFIANPEIPLSRSKLLEAGWGYSQDTSTRTVDNFIVRFRKYFEKDPKEPVHFKSMRSVGYVFHLS